MAEAGAPAAASGIDVEVVYCPARASVDSTRLRLGHAATAGEAVAASGVLQRHPDIEPHGLRLGIWGRSVPAAHGLRDGDRVEVYRPLQVEPKEARRLRQRAQAATRAVKGR